MTMAWTKQTGAVGRILAAALAFALLLPLAASAENLANKPLHPVFEGLLPPGAKPAAASLPRDDLKTRKLVIVSSANLDQYLRIWNSLFKKGNVLTKVFDVSGEKIASDPANVVAKIIPAVTPYFGSVATAPDIAAAHAMGADYILVVDYWASITNGGTRYKTRAGIHILNGQLQEALALETANEMPRAYTFTLNPLDVLKQDEVTLAKGMNDVLDPLVAKINASFAGAPN